MLDGLFIASLFTSCYQAIKEKFKPTIPAENWANKDLYHQDLMNGVSVEQRMQNLKNGKYKLTEAYPEPHRDAKTGQIIIENSRLYYEDLQNYGAYQAQQWVKQGKYNLTPEEFKKEEERIKAQMKHLYNLLQVRCSLSHLGYSNIKIFRKLLDKVNQVCYNRNTKMEDKE